MKKQRFTALVLFFCILFSSIALSSCEKEKTKFVAYSFDYFDTVTTITGYEEDQEKFDIVSGEILSLLEEYHQLYTIYHRFEGLENLCSINALIDGNHRVVKVDHRIIDMLLYAKEMYKITGGRINVAMGSVLSIWHDYRTLGMNEPSKAMLPPLDKLNEASLHTDINNLIIDEENSTAFISDPEMKLDVGAIAKGYAVERIALLLEERGISGYVINVGGNVRTIGSKPDGSNWIAGIEHPDDEADKPYVAYVGISGKSVVTSGSYQRYYIVDGKSYHHIIDPETLFPSEKFISVSVICKSSAQGDALSTALFCMPFDEGLALVESLDGVEAFWIMNDESTKSSSGFSSYITTP